MDVFYIQEYEKASYFFSVADELTLKDYQAYDLCYL